MCAVFSLLLDLLIPLASLTMLIKRSSIVSVNLRSRTDILPNLPSLVTLSLVLESTVQETLTMLETHLPHSPTADE
ncbi:hypothetical protein ACHAW6_008878 [Cyclotella cf. meneghiniana]